MAEVDATEGPAGSQYILFTDIYRSSRLSEQFPRQYASVLDTHNALVEKTVDDCGGSLYKNMGDGYIAFFDQAAECLACAVRLQREFSAIPPLAEDSPFLVRVVSHSGPLRAAGAEYFGPALNRASRICQVCHPGQVLASDAVISGVTLPSEDATVHDLGQHYLRDLSEPEHLYQLDSPGFARHDFPPLATLGSRPNNLVLQPNLFVGRKRELAELRDLLLGDRRLVTITAPGGYGKSRLAAHLCADLLESFERGVFFVELAPVREHTDIAAALATATGFQLYGKRDPKEQLIEYLREKELLLCFDNFEHVLAGAGFISDILREASRVRIVITSREPLRISGEQVYRLEPLAVNADSAVEGWRSDAVLLFADRASLVNTGFLPAADNLPAIQSICEQLSGIPLAIELAAAWTDGFTLSELQAELKHQLELTARLSDLPERHRSLRASLDWSWRLLTEEQRRVLMQLSTFRGGCFLEAAAFVTGRKGMALRQELSALCDKSWLFSRELDGRTRFFIRDAASREYAFERLEEVRESGAGSLYEHAVAAHARYFAELMEREGNKLHGQGQLEALHLIRQELQNIYEALDTLINRLSQQVETELVGLLWPIVHWLWQFLLMVSAYRELVEKYETLTDLAKLKVGLEQIHLWALIGRGWGLAKLGDLNLAETLSRDADALARALGDREGTAHALGNRAGVASLQGKPEMARCLFLEQLAVSREIGSPFMIAAALNSVAGTEYNLGNFDAAQSIHHESLSTWRSISDQYGIAISLGDMAGVSYAQGDYARAVELQTESLVLRRGLGNRRGEAMSLNNLALLHYAQGDYSRAAELHCQALEIKREIGDRRGEAAALCNLALVNYAQGDYARAMELQNQSLAIKREIGDRHGEAVSLSGLAGIYFMQRDFAHARQLQSQSLGIAREIGDRRGEAQSLVYLAAIFYSEGDYARSADLYSQGMTLNREIGNDGELPSILTSIGCLLATCDKLPPASMCTYGALNLAKQLGYDFEPIELGLMEKGIAVLEHPETGLPPTEREHLKVRAESMSLDELSDMALAELDKLKAALNAGKGQSAV